MIRTLCAHDGSEATITFDPLMEALVALQECSILSVSLAATSAQVGPFIKVVGATAHSVLKPRTKRESVMLNSICAWVVEEWGTVCAGGGSSAGVVAHPLPPPPLSSCGAAHARIRAVVSDAVLCVSVE